MLKKSFYNEKNIRIHLRVSYENQERLKARIDPSAAPLFPLKRNQFFNVRFEYKSFTLTYQGKKQEFAYSDIQKAETNADGLIIYLHHGKYVSIATENLEKHNSALYDAVVFLKKHNRRFFSEREKISYPEDAEGRYRTEKEPLTKISFSLSKQEIRRLLWYDYLIDEKMLCLILPIIVGFLASALFQNGWIAVLSGFTAILMLIVTAMYFKHKSGYKRNLQGLLYALLYDDFLVIRLHDTDLELEYEGMKRMKSLVGLWRMKSGDFFVLVLPKRIEEENTAFFDTLYKKAGKARA